MTIPWTGVGGYYTRLGTIIGEYNRVAALYGSGLDAGFQSIWSQFASSDQPAVAPLPAAVTSYQQSGQSYQNALVTAGQQEMLLQTADYYSVVPATVAQSVDVIAAAMVGDSQTIQRATLTSAVTPGGTNLGDATVCVSTTNQYGDPLDMLFSETITATCNTAPAVNVYAATLAAVGAAAVAATSSLWPAGSGASTSFAVTDPMTTGLITDGGFEQWGGTGNNTPTQWGIVDGAAGVTVTRGSGGVRTTSSYFAQIVSDGSQPTQLSQAVSLSVNTVYAVTVQAKISSTTATGTFIIALTDADGNVLQDDAGNDLSYTRNVNGQITASFAPVTAVFATPRQLPTTVNLQIGFSVAATAARVLSLDLAAVVAAQQLYPGGPFAAAFAGATPTALGDYYSLAFTNSLTSQSFARGADRLFGFRTLGVYWPSAISPSISNALVTH